MASMGSAIRMRTRLSGGFFQALLRRFFGGESLFVNEFFTDSHDEAGAELVLTQPYPGDIECVSLAEVAQDTIYLQPGAFVACEASVRLGVGWAGFASWLGGEGLFRMKLTGHGRVWFGAYGGILQRQVQDEYIVDTGHLVAYEPTVSLHVGLAGGIFSSFFGGEGLITRVRGPGRIYLQTRSIDGLASWTNGHMR